MRRDRIARAVFESSPGYRDWVRSVLAPELRSRLRRLLPEEFTDERIERVVRARLESPPIEDLERRLVRWHGDLTLPHLAFDLERRWTNAWIDGGSGLDDARDRRALVKEPNQRPTVADLARRLVAALGIELPAPVALAFEKAARETRPK